MNGIRTLTRRLVLVALLSAPALSYAQTVEDAIMLGKGELFTGALYSYDSWDEYWEGTLKRDNGNVGTLTTEAVTWFANYGVTSRLNVIGAVPRVWTHASQGVLHGMEGIQDLTIAGKYAFVHGTPTPLGRFRAIGVAAAGIPLTDYSPDFQPLSIGFGSKRLTGRFTANLQTEPGPYLKMDVWSSLFGDVTDPSMYVETTVTRDGRSQPVFEFDPSTAASKKWLDQFAAKNAATGVAVHHVSNNAPRNIADLDETLRRQGIATAKKWLDACRQIGARTMRVNTGGPRIIPAATATTGYPRNDEVVKYLKNAISSFKEMADYGGTVGVKVTIENHWGLSADPMNIRIILDELKHPFCEASPDFFNWEHELMLYHGLEALMPYTHTTVHAKYWNRWDPVDVGRCVRILDKAGYKGAIALEYEDGPWDGVEGAKQLMKLVMEA